MHLADTYIAHLIQMCPAKCSWENMFADSQMLCAPERSVPPRYDKIVIQASEFPSSFILLVLLIVDITE